MQTLIPIKCKFSNLKRASVDAIHQAFYSNAIDRIKNNKLNHADSYKIKPAKNYYE